MSDLKHKGKSQKIQGKNASSGSLSSTGMEKLPRTMGRGLGTEYANAVGKILDDAKNMRGSDVGFLGTEKKSIDVNEFSHSLVDKKKK